MKQSRFNLSETNNKPLPHKSYADRMNYKAELEHLVCKELSTSDLSPPWITFFTPFQSKPGAGARSQLLE